MPAPGAAPTILQAALQGLCPRCGSPSLFDALIAFRAACPACGLDFEAFNVGDGPAAFLTLIVGAIVVGAATAVELGLSPPWWVHLVWVPVTIGLVVGALRLTKAALIAAEYRTRAREGRILAERDDG